MIANIFQTIYDEFLDFIDSFGSSAKNFFGSIYNFLTKYMSPEVVLLFLITAIALIVIFVFLHISNSK